MDEKTVLTISLTQHRTDLHFVASTSQEVKGVFIIEMLWLSYDFSCTFSPSLPLWPHKMIQTLPQRIHMDSTFLPSTTNDAMLGSCPQFRLKVVLVCTSRSGCFGQKQQQQQHKAARAKSFRSFSMFRKHFMQSCNKCQMLFQRKRSRQADWDLNTAQVGLALAVGGGGRLPSAAESKAVA